MCLHYFLFDILFFQKTPFKTKLSHFLDVKCRWEVEQDFHWSFPISFIIWFFGLCSDLID